MLTSATDGLQRSARCAVAAATGLAIAEAFQLPFPLYAVIAAVIVTDPSPSETRRLALYRTAGTIVGAALGAVLSPVLPAGPVAIATGIFVAMTLSHALHMPAAAKLAGYVCAICLVQQSAALRRDGARHRRRGARELRAGASTFSNQEHSMTAAAPMLA